MSTEYDINYDDSRFKAVESEKEAALTEHEKTYDSMISNSDAYYQKQIDASKEWEEKQTQLQNEQTDFAIQEIEQQKADAQKDYTKEQSGAYVDWKKQSDQHGVRAEQIADQGMQNTGYSESSQVSMYNTYQNRVATARESFVKASQNYNNAITQARLQNNAKLAEIAYNALQQQLELSLQGFQYKNQLLLDKASQKLEIENSYYNRYQDVLQQINTENALAEQIRQYNASLAEEQRQFNYYNKLGEFANTSSGSGGSSSGGSYYKYKKEDGGDGDGVELDLDSVTKAGYSGSSGKTIAEAVNNGFLNYDEKTGKVSKTSLKQRLDKEDSLFSKTYANSSVASKSNKSSGNTSGFVKVMNKLFGK